jgi:hypothetical protein
MTTGTANNYLKFQVFLSSFRVERNWGIVAFGFKLIINGVLPILVLQMACGFSLSSDKTCDRTINPSPHRYLHTLMKSLHVLFFPYRLFSYWRFLSPGPTQEGRENSLSSLKKLKSTIYDWITFAMTPPVHCPGGYFCTCLADHCSYITGRFDMTHDLSRCNFADPLDKCLT